MAKDPAFLFYSQDFLVGTMAMPFEDRGRYITLLAYIHQNGHISEETIRLLVGSFSDILRLKFKQDSNGLYYNERLENEVFKRKKFTDSRFENGKLGGRPPKLKPDIKDEWQEMLDFFNNSCINCGCVFEEPNRPTKDHITPKIAGGTDEIYNLQPLCRECNSSKCADHETDYRLKYIDQIPKKLKTIWFTKPKPTDNLIENENVIVNTIEYLNKKVSANFKISTTSTQKFILARIKDGYSEDDFKKVIDVKTEKWLNDNAMRQFLRPETLFGNKFEGYLNESSKIKEHVFQFKS
jgi:uncharacterized phage protein (TIGR02220 family)